MNIQFKKAVLADVNAIWNILQQAIERRKQEGSNQWQDGYPNTEVIKKDIEKQAGFVLLKDNVIVGYVAVLMNDEPAYKKLEGKWLTEGDFVVFHRVAISESSLGMGLATKMMKFIEEFALKNNIYSIKADTNFDNTAMLAIFKKLGYVFCGKVYFRNSPRNAFEKVLL